MKNKKIWTLFCILTPLISLILSAYIKVDSIPNTVFIRENATLKSNYLLTLSDRGDSAAVDTINGRYKSKTVDVKLLGLLPVKSVNVRSVPEISLYPGGISVGVKLNTKGVLVVALSDVEGQSGKVASPAAQSGIEIGDSLLKINGVYIENSELLVREINKNDSKDLEILVERKGKQIVKKVKPVKSASDERYKIGLWVRDSTAGVGTLTFYDEKSKKFAALGHPVTDVDTGTILNINKGEIVGSSIVSIRKGIKGNPGELKGIFVNEDIVLGEVNKNTECGIFGSAESNFVNKRLSKPMKIALRGEIKEGKAKVMTTIDENGPKLYDIEIQKLLPQESPGPKSMVIKVTDPVLLEKTGGIVQGMSGSPIIQNNKIVGAVTHVLINKPDTGYGIYIEWMLKDSEILPK
jgi:stage IV sporulation protein B